MFILNARHQDSRVLRIIKRHIEDKVDNMKTLYESIFDVDIDTIDTDIMTSIEDFLKINYRGKFIISKYPDKDGKYKVSSTTNVYGKWDLADQPYLTNGRFKFTTIKGHFAVTNCDELLSLEGGPMIVNGNFCIDSDPLLKTLKGAPKIVKGDFSCNACISLTSLEGSPKEVGGYFDCSQCDDLISLNGSPEKIGGSFLCAETNITNLEGSPKEIQGDFDCSNCTELISLKGGPIKVNRDFDCNNCYKLKSLEGIPKYIGGDLNANIRSANNRGFDYEELDELNTIIKGDIQL